MCVLAYVYINAYARVYILYTWKILLGNLHGTSYPFHRGILRCCRDSRQSQGSITEDGNGTKLLSMLSAKGPNLIF